MKKTCPSCGGSGQLSYFQGVSRFLLTTEECPVCNGTGYIVENNSDNEKKSIRNPGKNKK